MMTVSLVYDLVFVAFLVLFFFIFYKKGFVSSFVNVFGFVIAFILGGYGSNVASKAIYERFIKTKLTEYVVGGIEKIQAGLESAFSNKFIDKLFGSFIESHSLDSEAAELANDFVSYSLESNVINVLRMIIFVLIFILAVILVRFIASLLEGVNELPIVGFPNQLLGGALGLIIGLVIMFIICSIISLILGLWESDWMNTEVIESSYLFSLLFKLNPFYT